MCPKDDENQNNGLTPLQRYLQRQQQQQRQQEAESQRSPPGSGVRSSSKFGSIGKSSAQGVPIESSRETQVPERGSDRNSTSHLHDRRRPHDGAINEVRAIEAGAPAKPSFGENSTRASLSSGPGRGAASASSSEFASESASKVHGGNIEKVGFLPRMIAYVVDLIILRILVQIAGALAFFVPASRVWDQVLWFAVAFFYFGWFYSQRGASPGKMVFGLQLIETGTGRRIGYGKSFLRETLGKILSATIFFLGFLLVIFRTDKRALHDLIFDTRVVRRRPSPSH